MAVSLNESDYRENQYRIESIITEKCKNMHNIKCKSQKIECREIANMWPYICTWIGTHHWGTHM